MKQEWVGLREFARRCGRRHRAAQKAIEDGRIPASAVRRDAKGRISMVELNLASTCWSSRTDADQAMRTTRAPIRTHAPEEPVQPVAPGTGARRGAPPELTAEHEAAFREGPALEQALLNLPAIASRAGVTEQQVDALVAGCIEAFCSELCARGATAEEAASAVDALRGMLAEEREHPGAYTT